MKNILVTGGIGYIGSHVVAELVAAGFHPVILDNFSNSDISSLERLEKLIGTSIPFYETAYRDTSNLIEILDKEHIDGVIHLAAFKAVGESVEQPLKYYDNNVAGCVTFLDTLLIHGVHNFVFSSTAAVYGNPPMDQVNEDTPCAPESPYGWSKYMDEIILRDTCTANADLKGIALRYFNVVGSHQSGIIGELPKSKPQNVLPIIVQAVAENKPLTINGNDYPTPDGTCLRDYIHVVDLARAHVCALEKIVDAKSGSFDVYCLGTGTPTSVLELISAFEKVNAVKVPYTIGPRRSGDPITCYAAPDKARRQLGWHATHTIDDAVRSAWQWTMN